MRQPFPPDLAEEAAAFLDRLVERRKAHLRIFQDTWPEGSYWQAHIDWMADDGEIEGYTGFAKSQGEAVYSLAQCIANHWQRVYGDA